MRGVRFPAALTAAVLTATVAGGVASGVAGGLYALVAANAKPTVGDDAPSLSPSQWLNGKGSVSWDKLKGRVILVENWATT